MKTLRNLLAGAAVLVLAASCLNSEDPYEAGFIFRKPQYALTALFANNQVDTVSFISYGQWNVTRDASATWCKLEASVGKAYTYYTFPLLFEQNTTGEGRGTWFTFNDTEHPGEAYCSIAYWQYATRGDGSLGSAADVKTIMGSDGSHFELAYDAQHRPLSLRITKEDVLLHQLTLSYNDRDSVLTVQDRDKTLTGSYSNDYQPKRLVGMGDTVTYASQLYDNYMAVSANYAFNLEHRTLLGNNTYYAYLLNGQSLTPDSLHNADSLSIARVTAAGRNVQKCKLEYSAADNRCQSVDVNQLIFGTEQCDPYQLLSLFRYARSSRIVSKVTSAANSDIIEVECNANGSVRTLTVKRSSGGVVVADSPLTYTFEY